MSLFILYFCIYLAFYILGAYATTDIIRLLKGSTIPVSQPECYCPSCSNKISLKDQIPFISYMINHGKCPICHVPIPAYDLFFEVFIFISLSLIASLFSFTWTAYGLCILFYETTKIVFLIAKGSRADHFLKNLLLSLRNNIILFLLIGFLFFLQHIV